jgi:hypothetical protein
MAALSIPRPGVEVIAEFRTTSPTILTPTLQAVVVGLCRQIVDVTTGGTINPQTVVILPASLQAAVPLAADAPYYKGLDGKAFSFSVLGSPDITVTLNSLPIGMTALDVVTQINRAIADAGRDDAVAALEGSSFHIRTVVAGEGTSLQITNCHADIATLFGWVAGSSLSQGTSAYNQQGFEISSANYPDPRNNLASLQLEPDSVQVYLSAGLSNMLRAVERTSAFLRGSGLGVLPTVVGTVDLDPALTLYGALGSLDGKTLDFTVDGDSVAITFASPADAQDLVAQINAQVGSVVASLRVSGSNTFLVLQAGSANPTSALVITGGTALALLGLTATTAVGHAALEAYDDGNGDNVTPFVAAYDPNGPVDFTNSAVPQPAEIIGSGPPDFANLGGKTLVLSDGWVTKTISFPAVVADMAALLSAISAEFSVTDGLVASEVGGNLSLKSSRKREDGINTAKGSDSYVVIFGGSAVNGAVNYLDTGASPKLVPGRTEGSPYPVQAGDELWVDGRLMGKVVAVAPNGQKNVLRLQRSVVLSFAATTGYYLMAKNLVAGGGIISRPRPDLIVSPSSRISIRPAMLRDVFGRPVENVIRQGGVQALSPVRALVYVGYQAIRRDVTVRSRRPALIQFESTSKVNELIGPVHAKNPLALGAYFASLNAPGTYVSALGIDEATADSPFGTPEAFTRAFEFLETKEVYAVAPMTDDPTVHAIGMAHAVAMSEPTSKGERIMLVNTPVPTHALDEVVASGTSGNSTADPATFETNVASLTAMLLARGINPVNTLDVSEGLYLDVGTDDLKYSISTIAGSMITLRTQASDFGPGDNVDGYYATNGLPPGLYNVPFVLKVRGAPLTQVDGTPDRMAQAVTLRNIGQGWGNHRVWNVVADKVSAKINGLEQLLEPHYLQAANAGAISRQPPQVSFTNLPIVGFESVFGTNDYFSDKHLDIIAAGGNWTIIQNGPGTPLFARMALTTDMRSVETRTDSITKVVDFTSKFMRAGLRIFIGRYNITQGFLDMLSQVVHGLGAVLVELGVLVDITLNNIIQDADNRDTVLIDETIDPPYPCNYIRLVLGL